MIGARVLVVDDEECASRYLSAVLTEAGLDVTTAASGEAALGEIAKEAPDLVVSDLRMPGMDGLDLLKHISRRWPRLPVIVLTIEEEIATVVEAIQLGAVNYLSKSSPSAVITAAIRKALRARPGAGGESAFLGIIGGSAMMREVRRQLALAARSDVNVLLTGKTGTGKELAARAIHRGSNLSEGPFVAVNSAAIPPDLFESLFFGHRKGAFTGAERDTTGLLDQADCGILFLDEVETLTPIHQAKMLRILDDGEVRPVGSGSIHRVCVRILAASNREPAELLERGNLREDLYYRLRGLEIRLPDLNRRVEDIPALAAHFLGESERPLAPPVLEALSRHDWPGNVRELRNVLLAGRTLAGAEPIGLRHIAFRSA
ncbi:MAG TPA: sigma-54 dependent transcriptional regulator, partial [Candidatus Saccharimonadales bacterium]|nr:sigma-54 dependent transcriptional regulator [Candidatus Saccharimonadales bacterium]